MLLAVAAHCDERSQKTLGAMSAAVRALGGHELRFTVSAGGEIEPMEGTATVSGASYRVVLPTGELLGDDKYTCSVDQLSQTVTLSPSDPGDRSLLSNPARAFDLLDGAFTHRYVGQATMGGRECSQLSLTPTDAHLPVRRLTLWVDGQNLPVALRYEIEGLQSPVEITVRSIRPAPQVDRSSLAFDKKRYKNYEIVDLR
ncbi:hypothetical protein FACS1894159_11510 [Bacteroidia bacterium]|nr:hypothetical protein FACS1894159_11510 [Bacteroidia bacterium]